MNLVGKEIGQNAQQSDLAKIRSQPDITKQYEDVLERIRVQNKILPVVNAVFLDTPAEAVKVLSSAVPFVGTLISDSVDVAVKRLKDAASEDGARILRTALVTLEKTPADLDAFEIGTFEARRKMVDTTLAKIGALTADERLFSDITDQNMRDEILLSASRLLAKSVAELRDELRQFESATVAEIVTLRKNLLKVNVATNELRQRQKTLETQRTRLESAVDPTLRRLDATSGRLDAERRTAVSAFQTSAKAFKAQVDATAGILAEVGAPRDAIVAANFVSGTVSLASAIALCTVDPTAILPTMLGGIRFVKGFMGNGAPDEQRALSIQILALQKEILDKLIKVEQEIRKNHREVLEALQTINGNVMLVYARVAEQSEQELARCQPLVPKVAYFDALQFGDGGMLRPGELPRFEDLTALRTTAGGPIARALLQPCKIALSQNFLPKPGGEIWSAFQLAGLSLIKTDELGRDQVVQSKELFKAYLEHTSKLNREIIESYLVPDSWWLYTQPSSTPTMLSEKLNAWSDRAASLKSGFTAAEIDVLKRNRLVSISPVATRRYVGWLLGAYVYFDLTDAAGVVRGVRELNAMPADGVQSVVLLEYAALILKLAIAQRVIDQGDVLLPVMYALIQKTDWEFACEPWPGSGTLKQLLEVECAKMDTPEKRKESLKAVQSFRAALFGTDAAPGLVQENRLLTANFGVYLVAKWLEKRGRSPASYLVAHAATQSPDLLENALGKGEREFVSGKSLGKDETGTAAAKWYVQFKLSQKNVVNIPLPDPTVVKADSWGQLLRFTPSDQLVELLDMQHILLDEIAAARFIRTLDDDQLRQAKALSAIGMSPF